MKGNGLPIKVGSARKFCNLSLSSNFGNGHLVRTAMLTACPHQRPSALWCAPWVWAITAPLALHCFANLPAPCVLATCPPASAGWLLRRLLHGQGLPGRVLLLKQRRLRRAGRRRVVHAGHLRLLLLPTGHLGPGSAVLRALPVGAGVAGRQVGWRGGGVCGTRNGCEGGHRM